MPSTPTYKHWHHIIPKHMGGTDDQDNLIHLTVEEHAEAHKVLFEKHGKKQDYLAWKGLTEQIGKEEIFFLTSQIGGLNNKDRPKSKDHKKKISETIKKMHDDSFEYGRKISRSMIGNKNSKNHSSDAYRKKQSAAMKAAWARRKAKD